MFYLAEACIYVIFLLKDWFGAEGMIPSDLLKYSALLLCAAKGSSLPVAAGEQGRGRKRLKQLLWCAAGADIFLLGGWQIPAGLILFIGVQCCYGSFWIRTKSDVIGFAGPALAAGAGVGTLVLLTGKGRPADLRFLWDTLAEAVFAAIYALLLIRNGLALSGKKGDRRLAESGRIAQACGLLMLCDLHVGLYNLMPALQSAADAAGKTALFYEWYRWTGNAMWLFYLPSMLCIVCAAEKMEGFIPLYRVKHRRK